MAKHWNPYGGISRATGGYDGAWERQPATATLASLRQPAKYWVVSDAQLKRDLKPRTLRDVYRENRAGRYAVTEKYVPRWQGQIAFPQVGMYGRATVGPGSDGGLFGARKLTLRDEYLAECEARGHVPHPASVDPDHPMNCHRDKAPKREAVDAFFATLPSDLREAA